MRPRAQPRPRPWAAVFVFLLVAFWFGSRAPVGPGWRDGAEISLAAESLSLLHPPGAPLYTLLARCFAALGSAFFVNLSSALATAAAAAVLVAFLLQRGGGSARAHLLASAALGWLLAAPGFQAFGSTSEVYACATLIALLVTGLSLGGRPRQRILAAYLLGLGLGVHPLLICLAPQLSWQRGRVALWLALGLSSFLFLPLRSSLDPVLDWGDPERWSPFLDVVFAREFASGLSSLAYAELSPWRSVGQSLAGGGQLPGLLLAASGLVLFLLRAGGWFGIRLLLSLGLLIWASLHLGGGIDVEGYLLVPRAVLALGCTGWLAVGGAGRGARVLNWATALTAAAALVVLLRRPPPGSSAAHGERLLAAVGESGVLLADTSVDYFALLYAAWSAESTATAVYTPLLARSWYRRTLSKRNPALHLADSDQEDLLQAASLAKALVARKSADFYYSPAERAIFPLQWLAPRGPVLAVSPEGPTLPAEALWSPAGIAAEDEELRMRMAQVHLHRARVFAARQQKEAALAAWAAAADWLPGNAALTAERAGALQRLGQPLAALAAGRPALSALVEADRARLHLIFGRALLDLADPQAALAEVEKALVLTPQMLDALLMQSRLALLVKDLQLAAESAARACALAPADPRSHAARGAVLVASGNRRAALQELRQAAALGSTDPAVAALRQQLEWEVGKEEPG